jgi:succinate dehydrogenase/fumarate reductase flavoprotein subunit
MNTPNIIIEEIISKINKKEETLDDSLKNDDFETLSKTLEERFELLKQLEPFKTETAVKNVIENILKKDSERSKSIEEKMRKIKGDQFNVQMSKKAMKKGYLKIEESISRHKINKSG